MNPITLHNQQITVTTISNRFFDEYMPKANGEFVKVYLLLVRYAASNSPVTISSIADQLNHTENDVLRALRYWEQQDLLNLSWENQNEISEITLCNLQMEQNDSVSTQPVVPSTKINSQTDVPTQITPTIQKNLPNQKTMIPPKQEYTNSKLEQFLHSEDIEQILYVAQKYLGTTLSSKDTNTILYFYDSLHFSADLIEYLIEYCVGMGQRNMNYIEKVALAWAEKGYQTVSEAKLSTTTYSKNCFAVMKAFGINNRRPGNTEAEMIQKWTNDYHFPIDIIIEACNRTIRAIHQPSFEYADRILSRWKKLNIRQMKDIIEYDKQFKNTEQGKNNGHTQKTETRPSNNRFNNVTPRNYAYDDLERQLLNS